MDIQEAERRLYDIYQEAKKSRFFQYNLHRFVADEKIKEGKLSVETMVGIHPILAEESGSADPLFRIVLTCQERPLTLGMLWATEIFLIFFEKFSQKKIRKNENCTYYYRDILYGFVSMACKLCKEKPDIFRLLVERSVNEEEFTKLATIL
jgi:hypothetical protein